MVLFISVCFIFLRFLISDCGYFSFSLLNFFRFKINVYNILIPFLLLFNKCNISADLSHHSQLQINTDINIGIFVCILS